MGSADFVICMLELLVVAEGVTKGLDTKETLDDGEEPLSTDDVCELSLIMSNPPHNELPPWLLCRLIEILVNGGVLGS